MVLCLLLVLWKLPAAASAAASEPYPYPTIDDLTRLCSLSLDYGVPGVEVRLYRVADVSADVRFTLTGDFAKYPVSLDDMDSAKWTALAQTLKGYVFLDFLPPYRTGVTDSEGRLTFSDLPVGLYLVDADRAMAEDGTIHQPAPFVISLPTWEQTFDPDTGAITGGSWQYNVSAKPKYKVLDGDVEMRRVLKVWDDGGSISRPAQITVALLQDGQVYDTVDLTEDNNWRYSWDELDGNSDWTLVETSGNSGYTVSVSLQGLTFVVTNSYSPPPDNPPPDNPPPDTTTQTDPPPDSPPPVPPVPNVDIPDTDVPLATTDPDHPDNPDDPDDLLELDDPDVPLANLPQTGQLWWPVPLLAVAGMALVMLGLIVNRRNSDEA